jgi:DNA repair exonuclease SbcCD ATPase subunit
MLNKRAEELESQARRQSETVNDMRIALDKAIQERADDEKKLASVRQTLAELRKSAQQRDLQIANLNALIAREEASAELADTRAKDFTAQWVQSHVPSLLAEPDRLRELGDKAWEYGIRDAADTMARRVLELA